MARKKISKSEQIRRYMDKHPTSSASEIAKAVGAKTALVYNVRSNASNKKKAQTRTTTARAIRKSRVTANGVNDANPMLVAAKFVKSCGGLQEARQVLNAVEELVKVLG